MPFTVTMPKLSPTMETGSIAKWHKKEGDKVNAGDVLLEVSTDKATVEHSALDEGYLRKILVKEGGEATVNQPIAIFTEDPSESITSYVPEGTSSEAALKVKETPKPKAQMPKTTPSERVMASPLAKKIAQERGVDLSQISGSGPRGRVVSKDLEKSLSTTTAPTGSFEEIPLTPVRKIISQRLQEAKSTIPHFYLTIVASADHLVHLRKQLEEAGVKVSFNDCMIKACALALKAHPAVNSGFNPATQTILQYKTIDISVAVGVESGLITPIIFHADQKSIATIASEVRALAKKAKEGKLAPHEFQGGSFTISNLGMFGISHFQAILNPPQSAILAVGAIEEKPVVKEGKIVIGHVVHLTLSLDHRVVDGVTAAQFLKTVQKYLENPIALLL